MKNRKSKKEIEIKNGDIVEIINGVKIVNGKCDHCRTCQRHIEPCDHSPELFWDAEKKKKHIIGLVAKDLADRIDAEILASHLRDIDNLSNV